MLAIRLQRTGRKGHAQFRVVVQDSRFSPTSGRVVAGLGSYNPHSKQIILDKDEAKKYLDNGAQPSDRVASLLKKEGVKLPSWVTPPTKKKRAVRNPEKLQKDKATQPTEDAPVADAPVESSEEVAEQPETSEEAPDSPKEEEATITPPTDENQQPADSQDESTEEATPSTEAEKPTEDS